MRALYSMATWLAQPLLKRKLKRRGQAEPGYLHAVPERFGDYDTKTRKAAGMARSGPLVWVHAVSLGETRVAAVLVAQLRRDLPSMRLLLTHGTATGRAEGKNLLREGDLQVWQPWDTVAATRRFVAQFKPDVGVLMETEVWPNLMAACTEAKVPVLLANARMSPKSYENNSRLKWLSRPAYAALAAALPQTEQDAELLKALGAPVRGVFGNLKYDAQPDARQLAAGQRLKALSRKPIVMFASSREGEESELLKWLRPDSAGRDASTSGATLSSEALHAVQWLIVPRHPQRFEAVAELAQMQQLKVSKRSTWVKAGAGLDSLQLPEGASRSASRVDAASVASTSSEAAAVPASSSTQPEIWLGDSLGEMALYFGMADVALLGGSFKPLGGQNLIEAIACGCPVIMGPHTFNFEQASRDAQARAAALRVADMGEAVQTAVQVVSDRPRLARLVQAGEVFSSSHSGAAKATAKAVAEVLRTSTSHAAQGPHG